MSVKLIVGLLAALAAAQADRSAEVPGLLVTLKSEQASVRAGAARTLGEIGPRAREGVPALAEVLRDADPQVRQAAAQALGSIGIVAQPAASALAAALHDGDWRVRRAAADALGRLGTREVEPALRAARKDRHRAVRDAAKASLDRVKKLPKGRKVR